MVYRPGHRGARDRVDRVDQPGRLGLSRQIPVRRVAVEAMIGARLSAGAQSTGATGATGLTGAVGAGLTIGATLRARSGPAGVVRSNHRTGSNWIAGASKVLSTRLTGGRRLGFSGCHGAISGAIGPAEQPDPSRRSAGAVWSSRDLLSDGRDKTNGREEAQLV